MHGAGAGSASGSPRERASGPAGLAARPAPASAAGPERPALPSLASVPGPFRSAAEQPSSKSAPFREIRRKGGRHLVIKNSPVRLGEPRASRVFCSSCESPDPPLGPSKPPQPQEPTDVPSPGAAGLCRSRVEQDLASVTQARVRNAWSDNYSEEMCSEGPSMGRGNDGVQDGEQEAAAPGHAVPEPGTWGFTRSAQCCSTF